MTIAVSRILTLEIFVGGVAVGAVLLGALGLIVDPVKDRRRTIGKGIQIGQVLKINDPDGAMSRRKGTLWWQTTEDKQILLDGDTLHTSPQTTLEIRLTDGSAMNIGSNTLLTLSSEREIGSTTTMYDFYVKSGSVEIAKSEGTPATEGDVKNKNALVPSQPIRLRLPGDQALEISTAGRLKIENSDGGVRFSQSPRGTARLLDLKSGTAKILKEEKVAKVVNLPPKLHSKERLSLAPERIDNWFEGDETRPQLKTAAAQKSIEPPKPQVILTQPDSNLVSPSGALLPLNLEWSYTGPAQPQGVVEFADNKSFEPIGFTVPIGAAVEGKNTPASTQVSPRFYASLGLFQRAIDSKSVVAWRVKYGGVTSGEGELKFQGKVEAKLVVAPKKDQARQASLVVESYGRLPARLQIALTYKTSETTHTCQDSLPFQGYLRDVEGTRVRVPANSNLPELVFSTEIQESNLKACKKHWKNFLNGPSQSGQLQAISLDTRNEVIAKTTIQLPTKGKPLKIK